MGHGNRHRGGGSNIVVQWKSLYDLKKACKFQLITLKLPQFSELHYWIADLPAGYFGKGSMPAQAVLAAYSHRGGAGGPVLLFETRAQKGFTPTQLMTQIESSHIFKTAGHDTSWAMHPMMVAGTVVAPSANIPDALSDAVAQLKKLYP